MADPAQSTPRISGVRSFARREHTRDLNGVNAAIAGIPFDTGASYRTGARFGPEAIRSASVLLREWDPILEVATLEDLRIVDWGDVGLTPGDAELAVSQIAEQLAPIAESGAVPLGLGGDHLVALGELRALAATAGPLGLILLDSHADTWDAYMGQRFFHGTPFKRAVEEGLIDPSRSLLAGMRGPSYSAADLEDARALGFEVLPYPELAAGGADAYGELARERAGDGPCFLSFDIDFVDPAFAPATGTPEVGGPSSAEALGYVRSLRDIDFRGFDVVEVSPPYDGPGQVTSLLAANVAYTMLGLLALRRRG
ncbi:MAG TPA: agmatinase [Solirubrobacterales bacterium]|nr:agmatinase [Solirubrobacterales bacterium]